MYMLTIFYVGEFANRESMTKFFKLEENAIAYKDRVESKAQYGWLDDVTAYVSQVETED